MNTVLKYAIICIVLFTSGFITAWQVLNHETIIIKKGDIVYETITRDVVSMPEYEKNEELTHFYTDKPELDIVNTGGDKYNLTAGLYKRKWNREVTISKASPQKKNTIIVSGIFDSRLNPGGMVQYYRTFGPVGIGGGFGGTMSALSVNAGVLFAW